MIVNNPSMNPVKPEWIPLADELPSHGMSCIVGNVNNRDPYNPSLGEQWKSAVFTDRQVLLDEMPTLMTIPLIGPRLVFQLSGESEYHEIEEFTHWWPIPKPFMTYDETHFNK